MRQVLWAAEIVTGAPSTPHRDILYSLYHDFNHFQSLTKPNFAQIPTQERARVIFTLALFCCPDSALRMIRDGGLWVSGGSSSCDDER
jgi:hypothetical protein